MISINHLIEKYLDVCQNQKNLSEKTIKAYRIDLTQYQTFSSKYDDSYSKITITSYISYLHKNYKARSVKRKVACLKSFFKHLEYEELISLNPFSKISTKISQPSVLPKTIPFATIHTILMKAYENYSLKNKSQNYYILVRRDIAVLELLFATGIRVSELCSLQIANVDLVEGTVKIFGKGSKERIVQIGNSEVLTSLNKYREIIDPVSSSELYFFSNRLGKRLSEQSVRIIIRKYASLSGLELSITPHMYRHSFATLLLEEDVDIRFIQKILGHSSILTTQIYTHVASNKQKMILSNKHPRNKMTLNKG